MIEEPTALTIRRPSRRPSEPQIAAFQGVATGFVADALGGGGALDMSIRPLGGGRDLPVAVAGPALTADNGPADILATMAAMDFVTQGDVLVGAVSGHQGCAAVGDRVVGMLRNAGGAGFVTDGPVRDYPGLVQVGLPVFCTGLNPASPHAFGPGQVGLPVQIGGQRVETGDMVVADRDGVVIVPFAEIDAVIARLKRIQEVEAEMDAEVAAGQRVFPIARAILDSERTQYVD